MSLISDKMREITKRKLGLYPEQIAELSEEQELSLLIQKNKKAPVFSRIKDFRKLGRGNPLLANKKIRTMDYVDSRLEQLNVNISTQKRGK